MPCQVAEYSNNQEPVCTAAPAVRVERFKTNKTSTAPGARGEETFTMCNDHAKAALAQSWGTSTYTATILGPV